MQTNVLATLAFLAVNNTAVIKYGFSRNEFLKMTIKDIRPKEDIPRLLEIVSQVTAGLNLSGKSVWMELIRKYF